MRRGEIWWAELPAPVGRRPVALVSRNEAYRVRTQVLVAMVTTRVRGIRSEVRVGGDEGLPRASVVNADALRTIPMSWLSARAGVLAPEKEADLDSALRFTLALAEPGTRRP